MSTLPDNLCRYIDEQTTYSCILRARERILPLSVILDFLSAETRAYIYLVLTTGSFDLVHAGHIRYTEDLAREAHYRAKRLQKKPVVIVGINSDESTRRNREGRSIGRPVIPELHRAETVAGFKGVNMVFVFDLDSELPQIRPDMLQVFAQSDHRPEDRPEVWQMVKQGTSLIEIYDLERPDSTSAILDRIHRNNIH